MVRPRRLELPRVAPQRPQRCASTNSATAARLSEGGADNKLISACEALKCAYRFVFALINGDSDLFAA